MLGRDWLAQAADDGALLLMTRVIAIVMGMQNPLPLLTMVPMPIYFWSGGILFEVVWMMK